MDTAILVVLIGATCNGKSYIAIELKRRYGFYSMHTDLFYRPENTRPPDSEIGINDPKKTSYIEEVKKGMQSFCVLEGSHVANQKELDIWVKGLQHKGKVYILEAQNSNFPKWFQEKYNGIEEPEDLLKWYKGIKNVQPECVVSSLEEVVNFLKNKGCIIKTRSK